jgi:hypothetical protein
MVRNQVSHPHKTGEIIILYNLLLKFLKGEGKTTFSEENVKHPSPDFNLFLISS